MRQVRLGAHAAACGCEYVDLMRAGSRPQTGPNGFTSIKDTAHGEGCCSCMCMLQCGPVDVGVSAPSCAPSCVSVCLASASCSHSCTSGRQYLLHGSWTGHTPHCWRLRFCCRGSRAYGCVRARQSMTHARLAAPHDAVMVKLSAALSTSLNMM